MLEGVYKELKQIEIERKPKKKIAFSSRKPKEEAVALVVYNKMQ